MSNSPEPLVLLLSSEMLSKFMILWLSALCVWLGARRSAVYVASLHRHKHSAMFSIGVPMAVIIPLLATLLLLIAFRSTPEECAKGDQVTASFYEFLAKFLLFWAPSLLGGFCFGTLLADFSLSIWLNGKLSRLGELLFRGICISLGLAISFGYCRGSHWLLADLLVSSYCVLAIQYGLLRSFTSAVVFLIGMSTWDIVFNYGFNMLGPVVSQSVIPFFVFFPRNFTTGALGKLGSPDIMVTGLYVALLARFDDVVAKKATEATTDCQPANYSKAGTSDFLMGLVATFVISSLTKRTTPAMPLPSLFCVVGSLVRARRVGELQKLVNFEDDYLVFKYL